MFQNKKSLLLLSTLLISGGVIGAQAQDEPAITAPACAEPGTLTMWVWDELWAEAIGAAIEEWQADYCQGAEVDLVVTPWNEYWTQLQTNAAAGDLPDIFNISQDRFQFYAENDAVLDLQPYLDDAGVDDANVWGSGMIDPYRWGEEDDLYAVPVNWDTIAIYYNKDMFDAAGLEYPTNEWTWDDFAEAARALTDAEADVYGATVYGQFQTGYPNWIAATGTDPLVATGRTACTATDEGSLEALNFLRGLVDENVMPTISALGGSGGDDMFNFWLAGRTAMVAGGSWKLPSAAESATFNWDVVQLPRHPETERSRSILHSVGYAASNFSSNPDLAANLILFLGSDAGQAYFAEAGGVAPANPGLSDEWLASFGETDVNIQTFVDAIQDSQGVTIFGEIGDAITELEVNIFDLGVPVEDATAAFCEQVSEYLVSAE